MWRWAVILLLALSTSASAQFTFMGFGPAARGVSVNACAVIGNQLDFTDATGCNLVQFVIRW